METFRTCALFHADFPDDHIENDEGDIVLFWGRGVTETIAGMAAGSGRTVSAPEHQHEHGWTFDVVVDDARVWFQVSNIEDDVFLLISEGYGKRSAALHLALLNAIAASLTQDVRISQLKWYYQKQLFAGFAGADSPLGTEADAGKGVAPSRRPASIYSLRQIRTMARIRPWGHFEVDFPDDVSDGQLGHWDFGKREAVGAIKHAFEQLGYLSTLPLPKAAHRWSLFVCREGRDIEFQFMFEGSYGRVFCKKPSLIGRYWYGDDEKYIAAIADLDTAMRRDGRFRDIRWQFHGGARQKTPGTNSPFSDTPELANRTGGAGSPGA